MDKSLTKDGCCSSLLKERPQDSMVIDLEDLFANRLSEDEVQRVFDNDENLASLLRTSQSRGQLQAAHMDNMKRFLGILRSNLQKSLLRRETSDCVMESVWREDRAWAAADPSLKGLLFTTGVRANTGSFKALACDPCSVLYSRNGALAYDVTAALSLVRYAENRQVIHATLDTAFEGRFSDTCLPHRRMVPIAV
ncbi:hypothetical protein B0T16DRAFT_385591 [Cercophora newfieldiana]|uniref:Uncharacterized protein n=1 Tax=Cercophora newfieldiana TaxID=92897 RepID=A0AA40D1N8_9PEZI|nr:hypothetical protein B0T16DRAFT_385591 [Cercophora newfieldiana]